MNQIRRSDAANDRQIAGGNFQQQLMNLLQLPKRDSPKVSILLESACRPDHRPNGLTENPTENSDAHGFYHRGGPAEPNSPQDFQDGKLEYSSTGTLRAGGKRDPEFAAAYSRNRLGLLELCQRQREPARAYAKSKTGSNRAILDRPEICQGSRRNGIQSISRLRLEKARRRSIWKALLN